MGAIFLPATVMVLNSERDIVVSRSLFFFHGVPKGAATPEEISSRNRIRHSRNGGSRTFIQDV